VWTFPVEPGTSYALTTQHLIWLLPASASGGLCPAPDWWDPLDYGDDWDNDFTEGGHQTMV
jgi:hypothetical protein